jgi:TolB-like protein
VYRKPETFDPRMDSSVRSEVSRLRRTIERYYEGPGASDPWRIAFPSRGYIPVITEAVELRKTALQPPLESEPEPTASVRRVHPVFVTAVASATVGVIVLCAMLLSRPVHETPLSIAVLPFTNLSADPANQYFSDGLTDEITDLLSHLRTLRVVARSSAFQFRGKTGDIREVGRQLNVTSVVEGSVERYADRVKVMVRLERVSDGSDVWSSTYERKTADLFSIQSDLAAGIAGCLKVAVLSGYTPQHVPNVEAHDHYMRGRYRMEEITPQSLKLAEAELQRAIELDPDYAAAYLDLGAVKFNQAVAREAVNTPCPARCGSASRCSRRSRAVPVSASARGSALRSGRR